MIVAFVTLVAFHGAVGHNFVNWDDDVYVYANPTIHPLTLQRISWLATHFYYYAYIPVTLLSHAMDVALWGMNPSGHHLTNVLLHGANAVWILFLGLLLLRAPARSSALIGMSIAAILFAIHPLRAESVSWVSDRKDLLCAFFLLPSVISYIKYSSARGTPQGRRWYVTSFLLFVLAALSKSIAVTLPAVLLLLDWLRIGQDARRVRWKTLIREKAPFFFISLVLTILSVAMVPPGGKRAYAVSHLSGLESFLFPFYSLSFSLYKTLLPIHLSPIYPRVGVAWMIAGLSLVVAITGVCVFHARRGSRWMLIAWLTYLLLLAPNIVGLSSGMQPVADRYSYLSTISLFLLLGAGIAAALEGVGRKRRLAVAACCGALAAILMSWTGTQVSRWRSSSSLWEYVIATFPPRPDYTDAYLNLGAAYVEERRPREARMILERAGEIDPTNAEVFYNLGVISSDEGDNRGAVEFYRKATKLDPHHTKAFYNLAVAYDRLGMHAEAVASMVQAARLGLQEAKEALGTRGAP